ncbi:MAG: hypothetical protein ABEI52_05300 [Halobacteriaceae archaeon]
MTTEIEYRNPTPLTLGEWQIEMANAAVSNASSNSPISSPTDIERVVRSETLIVRVPDGESSTTKQAIRNAIESHLPNATLVETRSV